VPWLCEIPVRDEPETSRSPLRTRLHHSRGMGWGLSILPLHHRMRHGGRIWAAANVAEAQASFQHPAHDVTASDLTPAAQQRPVEKAAWEKARRLVDLALERPVFGPLRSGCWWVRPDSHEKGRVAAWDHDMFPMLRARQTVGETNVKCGQRGFSEG